MQNKLIIGLTGLIGSGKSRVANIFNRLGADIVDTDVISHQLTTEDGNTLQIIAKIFGSDYIMANGILNRAKMRELIFNDNLAKIKLENLLHKLIYQKTIELIDQSVAKIIIVVVPLLFKTPKFLTLVDYAIFVDSDINNIYNRLLVRSSLSKIEVDKILASQVTRELQINMADDVISNNSTIEELTINVTKLYTKYLSLFTTKNRK